ncbi:hypothetical protein [Saccharopolyspora taberi]|uniref:Uncharacterized protein n=1 Tax=Saccharopolyspora taberi TaxID=60895 RepID=A0ABN3V163_9PSEU
MQSTVLLAAAAVLDTRRESIAFPLHVEPSDSGPYRVVDNRGREIADVSNAYDAGVLVDAYNTAHKAVA